MAIVLHPTKFSKEFTKGSDAPEDASASICMADIYALNFVLFVSFVVNPLFSFGSKLTAALPR
jgi:hypothetical protein